MTRDYKKVILIDLDGVLNEYDGTFVKDFIPPMKKGVKSFIEKLSYNFDIKLFTTRNRLIASKWLIDNKLDLIITDVTNIKEPCWLYIDDRCLNFNGNYEDLLAKIDNFVPWYKKTTNYNVHIIL